PDPFKDLEVARKDQTYRLRYRNVLSRERLETMQEMAGIGDLEAGANSPFGKALAELQQKTNSRLLPYPVPEAIGPAEEGPEFMPARAPFDRVQVRSHDDGYVMAIRGVMSDELRKELLAQAGKDDKLQKAIELLYRRSRESKVGKFLGRYVSTA